MADFLIRLDPTEGLSEDCVLNICKQFSSVRCRGEISTIKYLGILVQCSNVPETKPRKCQQQKRVKHVCGVAGSCSFLPDMGTVKPVLAKEMNDAGNGIDVVKKSGSEHKMAAGSTIEVCSDEGVDCSDYGVLSSSNIVVVNRPGGKDDTTEEGADDILVEHDRVDSRYSKNVKSARPNLECKDDIQREKQKGTRRNLLKTKMRSSLSKSAESEMNTPVSSSKNSNRSESTNSNLDSEVTQETPETMNEVEDRVVHPMNSVISERLMQRKKKPKKKFKLTQILSCTRS